jgi:hypothetical protein
LPSISWSASWSCFQFRIQYCFLPFSVHVQTNIICVVLFSVLWQVFKNCINFFIS